MRITELHVQNFKKIRAVALSLPAGVTVIGGANAAGKSSALDAIEVCLLGGRAMPPVPVRSGADSAEVSITLDSGHRLTRRIHPARGATLTIETADGMRPAQSPQAWVDAQLGALPDPMAWIAGDTPADDRRRAEVLRDLVHLDTADLDAEARDLRARRTEIGRLGKAAAGAAEALPHHPAAPSEPPDVAALTAQLRAAVDAELARARAVDAAEILASHLDVVASRARDLALPAAPDTGADKIAAVRDDEIARLEARIAAVRAEYAERLALHAASLDRAARDRAQALVAAQAELAKSAAIAEQAQAASTALIVPDRAPIEAALNSAAEVRRQVEANARRAEAEARAAELRQQYADCTERLQDLARDRSARIGAVQMPVQGLAIDEAGVATYQGLPISQASGAERIRLGMAVALAAAPKLRVVLVRDASLLDAASLALVAELAEAADAQVILERVGDGDPGAVVIEDGEVRP